MKASNRRLTRFPHLIKFRSKLENQTEEGVVTTAGWELPPGLDTNEIRFARCRIVHETNVSFGDIASIPKDKLIEIKRIK